MVSCFESATSMVNYLLAISIEEEEEEIFNEEENKFEDVNVYEEYDNQFLSYNLKSPLQFDQNYLHFYHPSNSNHEYLKKNIYEFCTICFETKELIRVGECNHFFCEECLMGYVEYCLGDISLLRYNFCKIKKDLNSSLKTIELQVRKECPGIKCPSKNCNFVIELHELADLSNSSTPRRIVELLNSEWIGKNSQEIPFCKLCTLKTPLDLLRTGGVYCKTCDLEYCECCFGSVHSDFTCKQWKEELIKKKKLKEERKLQEERYKKVSKIIDSENFQNFLFKKWLEKKNELIRSCPNCMVPIEKNEGCDHMFCIRCKTNYGWSRSHRASSNEFSWTFDIKKPSTTSREKKVLRELGYSMFK